MKSLFVVVILLLGLSSIQAHAEKVYLQPGDEITFNDAPTTVVCLAGGNFRRYCRCSALGLDGQWQLELILHQNGASDTLASYPTQEKCEERLERNPACRP